jgi:hypothetical protein
MKSPGIQNRVPKVPADLSALDQTLKHLRKLRWIGKEVEVQKILQALDDTRLQPSFPGRSAQGPMGQLCVEPLRRELIQSRASRR